MADSKSSPATRADVRRLDAKTGALRKDVRRLEGKIDSGLGRLNEKIDSGLGRLDEKIDSGLGRLDEKIDSGLGRLDADVRRLDAKIDSGLGRLDADVRRLDAKIDSATTRLAKEIIATQTGVREIKETMATKKDVDRILVAVEAFAGKAQVYDRAAVLHGRALTEAEVTLRDHEKRLRAVEARA